MFLTKICIFSVLCGISVTEKVRYDNFSLYKVHTDDEEGLQYLKDLYKENKELDFWYTPSKVGDYASVVTPPQMREEFEHSLKKRSIRSDLMLDNIQEAFDAQLYSRRKRDTSATREMFWTNYHSFEDIVEWFNHLAETYPNVVTIISAGVSHEGRNITGVKISRRSGRRAFLLEGGQIAADWLSPTVLAYTVDQLVNSDDAEARAASEDFEWHIFPVVNPDGHNYTLERTRTWIKNRRPTSSNAGNSIGVDLSRNWNSQWGVSGASFTPAHNNYAGLGPFSEIETRSLSRYIENIANNLAGVLSFRGFGQKLVIPFAHTGDYMLNYQEMLTIGRRAMGSLSVRYGTQYLVGNSLEVHNGETGVLADWVKYRFNPPIAATYLLRDNGQWGYTLPVNQVEPSCQETFDSLMAILREAKFINVL